jgi:hypothetical protein
VAKTKDMIKLNELDDFLHIDGTLTELKKDVAQWQEKRDGMEKALVARIESGADLSQTEKDYNVKTKTTLRRFPKWKIEFEKRCGIKAAVKVLNSTPAITYKTLIVALKSAKVDISPVKAGRRKK